MGARRLSAEGAGRLSAEGAGRLSAEGAGRLFAGGATRLAMDAMQMALEEAAGAAVRGEVPVGAVVLAPGGAVLARAGNGVEAGCDASAHAELVVMRAAARLLGSPRLLGCTVVVTLEPCAMCAGAMVLFRVERLMFGAYDPKGGGVEHGVRVFAAPGCLHRPAVVGGIREAEAGALLRRFFAGRRA